MIWTHPAILVSGTFLGTVVIFISYKWLSPKIKAIKVKRAKAKLAMVTISKKVKKEIKPLTPEVTYQVTDKIYSEKQLDELIFYEPAQLSDLKARRKGFLKRIFHIPFKKSLTILEREPIKNKVLIRMEMNNGHHREFWVKETKEGFTYNKKKYVFDLPLRYYIEDSKTWAYDYHESFVLPIARRVPVIDIKESIESSKISEIEYAVNPTTLERFVNAEIAQGILQGAQLGKVFKIIMVLTFIVLGIVFIDFLIDVYMTGVFDKIMAKVN